MTPQEASHLAAAGPLPGLGLPGMVYAVILRLDAAGANPVILREDSPPLSGEEGVRYRFVAQTDDHGEAVQVVELLQRRLSD